jgi:hypothetical protein
MNPIVKLPKTNGRRAFPIVERAYLLERTVKAIRLSDLGDG